MHRHDGVDQTQIFSALKTHRQSSHRTAQLKPSLNMRTCLADYLNEYKVRLEFEEH